MTNVHPFGETFKKLRQMRSVSVKDAAGEIVSPQFLRQFEKGEKNISIENFSRLLISIGIDWEDFLVYYDGDRINKLNNLVLKKITNGMPTINDVKAIIEESKFYLNDNPLQKEMFITSLESRALMKPDDAKSEELRRKIFNNQTYTTIEFFNDNETNYFAHYIESLPFQYFENFKNFLLFLFNKSTNVDDLFDSVNLLAYCIRFLSVNGYYTRAQKIIDELNSSRQSKGPTLIEAFIYIDIQDVYNRLRQNDVTGVKKAKKVLNLLGALDELEGGGKWNRMRVDFLNQVHLLNKTSQSIME
ncbi:TPA: helix-turn-helix transcriptional regulator [Streptococcus suis]|nr:helix-turn-helix transcriptional regulator [Streptococcus suis]HEM5149467.1 helix-turn-helix transcriptional regulator [Streptococcus suis]HEM5204662.1 helix-turn-helix transcriptional regulator [Streptococcus suis]HEM5209119.1 helix-turn-helix transcriptional regulator [Streptococcus suis]HEM5215110.1 helix-turn-helix transcriptional regulator [Streptococcus suis]